MPPVTVQFLKNPDIPHWGFEGRWLGEDEWGVWTAVPAGSPRWKGTETRSPTAADAVFCAPSEGWWHLHYNGNRTGLSHFVDVVTPAVWVSEDRYEMVDLDLDVVRHQDGVVEIEDEDEFAEHQLVYGYTEEMIDTAVVTAARVRTELTSGAEPFFSIADSWLARV